MFWKRLWRSSSGMLLMRSRNMAEKLISVTPSNSPSSTSLLQTRMRLRCQGSDGTSSGWGNVSSRYSQISVDSITGLPSWTSVGTTPLGLSLRYFGSYCSLRNRSTFTACHVRPFSHRVMRTFWQQTELPKSESVSMQCSCVDPGAVRANGATPRPTCHRVGRKNRSIFPIVPSPAPAADFRAKVPSARHGHDAVEQRLRDDRNEHVFETTPDRFDP